MILAKYPFGLYNIPFPSQMGRSLLVAVSKIADKTVFLFKKGIIFKKKKKNILP